MEISGLVKSAIVMRRAESILSWLEMSKLWDRGKDVEPGPTVVLWPPPAEPVPVPEPEPVYSPSCCCSTLARSCSAVTGAPLEWLRLNFTDLLRC